MRTYVVRAGDSPASIAAKSEHAGCPRCAKDLVDVNRHKASVTHPNGFRTFRDLRVGERLWLPEKWFNGELDRMPQAYFNSLPRHDGVTPGVGQAPVSSVDASPTIVNILMQARNVANVLAADPNYCASVGQAGSAVNVAIHDFKVAWNANTPGNPVPIGTGNYEPATAAALAAVLGTATPPACPEAAPQPLPAPAPAAQQPNGLSVGSVTVIGVIAAAAVGIVVYEVSRQRPRHTSSWQKHGNYVKRRRRR